MRGTATTSLKQVAKVKMMIRKQRIVNQCRKKMTPNPPPVVAVIRASQHLHQATSILIPIRYLKETNHQIRRITSMQWIQATLLMPDDFVQWQEQHRHQSTVKWKVWQTCPIQIMTMTQSHLQTSTSHKSQSIRNS